MRTPIDFEGIGMCYYGHVAYRAPMKGEHYLGPDRAYRAPNNLSSPYHIVQATHYAHRKWSQGAAITPKG